MSPIDDVSKIDTSDDRKAFDLVDDNSDDVKENEDIESETKSEDQDAETKESSDEEDDEEKLDDENDDNKVIDDETVNEEDSLYQQVKKASPDLFKKVPELKRVLFREAAYTEVFSTVEEARGAAENLKVFETFQNDAINGNSEKLLLALEQTGKDSLEGFAANFIPTLEKVNKDLYLGILYPEFKKMLRAAARSGDERLTVSAQNLNWFIFNNTDLSRDAGLKPKAKDPRNDEITERERQFEERIYNTFAQDVGASTKGRTLRVIDSAFKDSGLTEWQQKKLTDDIFTRVDAALTKDIRHTGQINQIWLQAKKAGFTSDYKDRLTNAYLSRAKLLIPKVRQQVLSEAKINAKIRPESQSAEEKKRPTRINSSGVALQSVNPSKKVDPKTIDWNKTSEKDLLSGNYVTRK